MGVTTTGVIANDPVLGIYQICNVLEIQQPGDFRKKFALECKLFRDAVISVGPAVEPEPIQAKR
jgi:hypothetical protein